MFKKILKNLFGSKVQVPFGWRPSLPMIARRQSFVDFEKDPSADLSRKVLNSIYVTRAEQDRIGRIVASSMSSALSTRVYLEDEGINLLDNQVYNLFLLYTCFGISKTDSSNITEILSQDQIRELQFLTHQVASYSLNISFPFKHTCKLLLILLQYVNSKSDAMKPSQDDIVDTESYYSCIIFCDAKSMIKARDMRDIVRSYDRNFQKYSSNFVRLIEEGIQEVCQFSELLESNRNQQ